MMAFGGTAVAQLSRMVELMNPVRIVDTMILNGINIVPRSSDSEEAQWEVMLVCLFTAVWQKFQCAILTVCKTPMNSRTQSATAKRHNERVVRWNNIVRNLASRNAGRMILMDLEHEPKALDQARFSTDRINFDSIERQGWMNRVFHE